MIVLRYYKLSMQATYVVWPATFSPPLLFIIKPNINIWRGGQLTTYLALVHVEY